MAELEQGLLRTIETLCGWERASASEGERRAARWIARALRERGCDVEVDEERGHAGFAEQCAAFGALGVAAALLGAAGRPRAAALLGVAAAASMADEAANGPRLVRGAVRRTRPVLNVVARTGDLSARDVLVVLAHHDAAQTGRIFDPRPQHWVAEHFPALIERTNTSIPLWWGPVAGPLLAGVGRGRVRALGATMSAAAAASFADIARSPVVPGASDNLTAVAALLALAEAFDERPVEGLQVWLVSCGAEEALQEGMRAFAARRLRDRDRSRTWVLNLETLGSPGLSMLEGEGTVWMEEYTDPSWRDRIDRVAGRASIPLRRGLRARASTDSVIASRMGFPTATLVSVDAAKALAHYHLPSDLPENVELGTVARAVHLVDALARDLAG